MGDSHLLSPREFGMARKIFRHRGDPAPDRVGRAFRGRPHVLLSDLGSDAARVARRAQPPGLALRTGDPRAQGPHHHGGKLRGRHCTPQDRGLRLRSGPGLAVGLALCAFPALHQPAAVRSEREHRLSLHGGDRWIDRGVGCGHRGGAAHVSAGMDQGSPPEGDGAERQLRDRGVRAHRRGHAAPDPRWACILCRPSDPPRHEAHVAGNGRAAPDTRRSHATGSRCSSFAA